MAGGFSKRLTPLNTPITPSPCFLAQARPIMPIGDGRASRLRLLYGSNEGPLSTSLMEPLYLTAHFSSSSAARLTVAGDANTIVARAREAGVGIGGLAPYFTSRPSMRGFMFGDGSIDDRAIREGLVRLRRALP
jgi:hypothetical protein